ncbi:hypothetical protein A3B35_00260 [Candidatus Kaiserbacteria bacterium RIFCSPLOWO2_01_FULL_54_24]|uniref:Uncharacterized protein n=1 Tax=Candidatus Kaiserbacteria bacterium RIFCSPLOWO2_01_FULL_54_24 TaxID=1798515 RepID=A0A1F6ETR8_9BACT|nr:MAG: hypothetical protein A3B35_00260 [Candidatus Kaiserbacteria bacterium RIFCSPLOWO2_01_FULL_54_24]
MKHFSLTVFLKNIGANHSLRNRQFEFSQKWQYARAASQSEAASSGLHCPIWLPLKDKFRGVDWALVEQELSFSGLLELPAFVMPV